MRKAKGKSIPDPLTADECAALLQIPNRRYPTGLRNLAMIRLMLSVGLRCAEVLNLQIKDIDLNSGKLHVHEGKGAKDRILWLDAEMLALIQQWRERRPMQSEYYFTTLKGERLDGRYMRAMMERYKGKAGIIRHCSPHTLRHTFATNLLRETGNIELVRKALGHADVSTTGIYLHATDTELENALKTYQGKISR